MRFPTFPHFRRLTPNDRTRYLTYYTPHDPYSDFSFNNLLIWLDQCDDLEVSEYNKNIILRFTNVFESNQKAYTIIGDHDCLTTIEAVFDWQKLFQIPQRLVMVPETVVAKALQAHPLPKDLVIMADADNRDYIFEVKPLLEMQGALYSDLRREIRVVEARIPDLYAKHEDLTTAEVQQKLLQKLHEWNEDEYFMRNDPMHIEIEAISRYFSHIPVLTAECIAVYSGTELISFAIFHFPPQRDWVIFNHIKCNYHYKFIYNYTNFIALQYFAKKNITYINFEQDLGIPGLRYHKNALRPKSFLYRYDIKRLF